MTGAELARFLEEERVVTCASETVRDLDAIAGIGAAVAIEYVGFPDATPDAPEIRGYVGGQAARRVGLRFRPTRIVSCDHRKLGA